MPERDDIDFAALAGELLSDITRLVPAWLPSGRFERREYVALNPTRADRTLGSFRINIDTGMWSDFATGDRGGDLISLRAYLDGMKQIEAARKLGAGSDYTAAEPRATSPRPAVAAPFVQVMPAPEITAVPDHPTYGRQPDGMWTYRTEAGELIGFVCRYNTPTEEKPRHKDFSPYVYVRDGRGRESWKWTGFSDPRPLYGLETLEDGKPVILVEGEKTANAGRTLFPNHAVLTWPGGDGSWNKADLSPLYGRDVILWPDNDAPGRKAMAEVAVALTDHVTSLRTIEPPENCPPKWDLADARWSPEEAARFLGPAAVPAEEPPDYAEPPDDEIGNGYAPFVCLGHARGTYYYHAHGTQEVIDLSRAEHTKSNLMGLAPLNYWEREFGGNGKSPKVEWDCAANWMFRSSERVGIFDRNRIRGRGAWFDDGRIVLNLGNKVIVGEDVYHPSAVPSDCIYEAGAAMKADLSDPLDFRAANKFYELLAMMPWEREVYARLVAGWCVCAHIGGALDWRPHIWITGKKGSGKSTVTDKVIGFILGSNCLAVISESTAPGIRQDLGSDSIPVTFDEAEGNDAASIANLQKVLALARQSSSETIAKIVKGGSDGEASKYHIRSCFLFSSISSSLIQESDKSRVTLVELSKEHSRYSYEDEIIPFRDALLTEDYRRKFYARAIKLAPVIRKNARTFANAVAKVLGEQRAGDQYGALLAGAYSLHSSKVISKENAEKWVAEQNWETEQEAVSTMTDELKLWHHLVNTRVRFRASSNAPQEEIPVGELIDSASGREATTDVPRDRAADELARLGIKASGTHIWIANDFPYVRKMLEGTPWQVDYMAVLKRLPGADSPGKVRFKHSASSMRCTRIPLEVMG